MKAVAPTTANNYNKTLVDFHHFIASLLPGFARFPANSGHVVLYVAHLFSRSLAPATIQSKLSAITYVHKLYNMPDPCDHFLVQKIMCGVKKCKPQCDTRAPFSLRDLQCISDNIPSMGWSLYDSLMYRAMCLLAFHAFLRPGEITDSVNCLFFHDVSFVDGDLSLTFVSFKHHAGKPVHVFVTPTGDSYCPVSAVRRYITIRGDAPGRLFVNRSGRTVSYTQFSKAVGSLVKFCQLDPLLSLHSFRIGAATHAALLGVPESDIKRLGRWNSDSWKKYVRITTIRV